MSDPSVAKWMMHKVCVASSVDGACEIIVGICADEIGRYKREIESLKRQNSDSADEMTRLRQSSQRVHELEFIVESERQTFTRLKTDYEEMKTELETFKRNSHAQALERPRAASGSDEVRMLRNQLAEMELANSKLVSRHAQQREEWERSQEEKLEEFNRASSNGDEDWKIQVLEVQSKCKRLESQLSEQSADNEDLEKRCQQAKKRTFEVQEKLDEAESELLGARSKLRQEASLKAALEERLSTLEAEVQEVREKGKSRVAEVEALEAERAQLKKQLRDAAEEQEQVQLMHQQKASLVTRLEAEVASLKLAAETQQAAHREEISRLRKQLLDKSEVASTPLPSMNRSVSEEMDSLLREERSKVQRLSMDLDDMNMKMSSMNTTALAMNQTIRDREEEIELLQQKVDNMRRQQQQHLSEVNDEEFKLKSLARAADETKRQLEEEVYSSAAKDRKIKLLQEEVMDLNQQLADATAAGASRETLRRSNSESSEMVGCDVVIVHKEYAVK
jgi:chromosome segregation ATPase